jgi:hypothetical protein
MQYVPPHLRTQTAKIEPIKEIKTPVLTGYAAAVSRENKTVSAPVLKSGWVSLRDPAAFAPAPINLDARLKTAGEVLRRRWDAYNELHEIDYSYNSPPASDDEAEEPVEEEYDDAEDPDYEDELFV